MAVALVFGAADLIETPGLGDGAVYGNLCISVKYVADRGAGVASNQLYTLTPLLGQVGADCGICVDQP